MSKEVSLQNKSTDVSGISELDPKICNHIISDIKKELSININLDDIQMQGRKLYKTNPHMRDLAEFMEHPESRAFFEKYLNNSWVDIKVSILHLKLYYIIDKHLKAQNPHLVNYELNGYHTLYTVDKILKNSDARHAVCKEMTEWVDSTNAKHNDLLIKEK